MSLAEYGETFIQKNVVAEYRAHTAGFFFDRKLLRATARGR